MLALWVEAVQVGAAAYCVTLYETLPKKNLAIFYGAAHLPDLEERMVEKMGFERKATRWVTAWKLPERVELKNPNTP